MMHIASKAIASLTSSDTMKYSTVGIRKSSYKFGIRRLERHYLERLPTTMTSSHDAHSHDLAPRYILATLS